ncbi:MAG: glutaredoxin family protein [Betaproteobacteria bacterium]|nr:MAG: glutaredoxin family protein [Betaproteobacteria bacterium]
MRSVLAAALCLAAFAASAQVYRWTDDKGRVHITDTPPPASAKNVRKSGESAAPTAAQPAGQEPFAVRQARATYPIKLYTAPGCDACAEARNLLNARGLPFSEVSVITDEQLQELKKVVGSTAVPALVVGSTVQRGFLASRYHGLLDAAGYPKTGVLPPRDQAEPTPPAPPGLPEVKPAPEPERPTGPYAPGAPPQKSTKK